MLQSKDPKRYPYKTLRTVGSPLLSSLLSSMVYLQIWRRYSSVRPQGWLFPESKLIGAWMGTKTQIGVMVLGKERKPRSVMLFTFLPLILKFWPFIANGQR